MYYKRPDRSSGNQLTFAQRRRPRSHREANLERRADRILRLRPLGVGDVIADPPLAATALAWGRIEFPAGLIRPGCRRKSRAFASGTRALGCFLEWLRHWQPIIMLPQAAACQFKTLISMRGECLLREGRLFQLSTCPL